MLRHPTVSPLAGALAIALSLPAVAAPVLQATDLDRVEVRGERDRYDADATRTATKTDTPLRDVPQSITVVTDELIQDQAMTNMADVVRYVPGIGMAQGEGHRDAPVIRGNISTADFFVNGLRDDVQYLRDLYNVERVEALKGPNSMIFGRGGSGGVINRVTKVADWREHRELGLQVGEHGRRRGTFDLGGGQAAAFRVTGVYEDSESFRDEFELERYGVNPTLALRLGEDTRAIFGYEHFRDKRTTDRGVPSFRGLPLQTDPEAFFGDPDNSFSDIEVNVFDAVIEHDFGGGVALRNATRYGDYDKFYQNVFPGAVNAAGTHVALTGYNSATRRENLFNQTDLTFGFATGAVAHTVVVGAEYGRQETDNLRINGVFPSVGSSPCSPTPTTSSFCVPIGQANTSVDVSFPQAAPGVDNRGVARIAAVYVQDQIEFSSQWQAILGARFNRFEVDFQPRAGAELRSDDDLFSPRAGLVYKPLEPLSFYASYSLAHQPRAGEQLNSLSLSNQNLEPEEFRNYEVGAKWDVRPELSATLAVYRLDRTNVVTPVSATESILARAQRTEGVEIGLSGRITDAWSVMGAYAYQDGEITRASGGLAEGTRLAQLPEHSASLWNRYDFSPAWGVGLGAIYRGEVFATTSNTVRLKSFTRYDAALYYTVDEQLQMQLNVENVFDKAYHASAHNNDNISPGAPRSVNLGVNFRF